MLIPQIEQVLSRLNEIDSNITDLLSKEHFVLYARLNDLTFYDMAVKGENSIAKVYQESSILKGYPTNAYEYGTLITLNPTKSKVAIYSTIQIYITDKPYTGTIENGTKYGVFVRAIGTTQNWVYLSGSQVTAVS